MPQSHHRILLAIHLDSDDTMLKMQLSKIAPHHCELNSIELIWEQIKTDVARNNRTFKLGDMKLLLNDSISSVTAKTWSKCILHIKKEEQRMRNLDNLDIKAGSFDRASYTLIELVIINLPTQLISSSSDCEFDNDSVI
ncbi:hypothetical protein NQ317_014204 [Molorchus minor]|uniref:Transposase n=1 Tax=Molorchus minor TaxID=1323400 RepID=A0ABQ9JB68_9CUCU|nr:hypothetical protein NQ317_014204 [Molorchus minor]